MRADVVWLGTHMRLAKSLNPDGFDLSDLDYGVACVDVILKPPLMSDFALANDLVYT